MASVTLEHVSKRFGDVVAVDDLSLHVADGEFLAIVGPSGCGKTTVLRLIAGLEAPDDGTISIDGRVVDRIAPGERNVAMVFEDYALYPHLLVRDNLGFALRVHRTPAEEIRHRVSAVATSLELGGLLDRRPPGLAAGEAQHVAIGRAVMREAPAAFLLDDALTHLDARQRLEARAELGRLHRELRATIISVTHDQAEALAIATRVAVLDAGVLQQVGPPRALYEHPANVFVAGFVGSPPMNLVEMTLVREGDRPVLRSGDLALPAPARIGGPGVLPATPAVVIGFRPEHVRVASPPGDGDVGFVGRCDLVEYLGHRVLIHLRVGDLELTALSGPAEGIRVGDSVECAIADHQLHVFDARTGRSLDADPADAGAT
jgi:multiple sugar transport system ATP-binding protein